MPVADAQVQMLTCYPARSPRDADRLTSGYAIGGYYKNLAEVAVYGFDSAMGEPDIDAQAIIIAGGSDQTTKDSINGIVASFEIDTRMHGVFTGKRMDPVTIFRIYF